MFLLKEANVAFGRRLIWYGTGGKSSSTVTGRRLCGVEFGRGRSRMCTSLTCGESCPKIARLRWDEREGALTTCGATGDGSRLNVTSLAVVVADGGTSSLLE